MTALAKLGRFSHQHVIMIAPVDLMAIKAVLHNRGVFPPEGPSFFSMALITKIIDGIGLYHFLSKTAMRVVTACTVHPAFLNRMMRLFVHHDLYIFMAAEAEFRLGRLQMFLPAAMD